MRLLIIKTSSMGDVVHALPAVSDLLHHCPGVQIDWLVEAPFADIARMHTGISRVLPLAWRKWRRRLFERSTWAAMGALRSELQAERYDLVLDLQGLLKSALWGVQARGPLVGYDRTSAREGAAAMFYQRSFAVPRDMHAVQRCRQLAAMHLGYPMPRSAPDFALLAPKLNWPMPTRYAVLIPNASRREKLWPEQRWVAVGRKMLGLGLTPVVLWGTDGEQSVAERIAADCGGTVPPFLKVGEMAALLASAHSIVGLDTGFTHLGAALGRPTIGIYCDHEPGLAGIVGPESEFGSGFASGFASVASIGGKGQVPRLADVVALLEKQLLA